MRRLALLLFAAAAAAGPLTEGRVGPRRAERLAARGGSAATEKAVEAALAWLARHQEPEGHWDCDGFGRVCGCEGAGGGWHGERVPCPFDAPVTALATLAFLGSGHSPAAGAHREVVARAIAWLRPQVRGGPGASLWTLPYALQALVEAYDLGGDATLGADIERGVAALVGAQRPDGGWGYFIGMEPSGVPNTAAVVAALAAARDAGFDLPRSVGERVLPLLDALTDARTAKVAYTPVSLQQGMTPTTANAASALLCRVRLGLTIGDPRVRAGAGLFTKSLPRWSLRFRKMKVRGEEMEVQIGNLQHYTWAQATEALARLGGSSWTSWNGAMKGALLPHQRKEGHAAGSWDPVGTYGDVGGRVYSTALCAMMLESYYR